MRQIPKFLSTVPQHSAYRVAHYSEELSDDFLWFLLRRLADVPASVDGLFVGPAKESRKRYADFRAYVRQGKTYWDAGLATNGAPSALLYYYGALQLAKAELTTDRFAPDLASIHHGLSLRRGATNSIKGDCLVVRGGVFRELVRKRTGVDLPSGTSFKVTNLLSLIPEIGLEMSDFGTNRTPTVPGCYAVAMSDTEAWALVLLAVGDQTLESESVYRKLMKNFEEISIAEFSEWRSVFAMSSRRYGRGVRLFQSKNTSSTTSGLTQADINWAVEQLYDCAGDHVRPAGKAGADFWMTPTIAKSKPLVLPLDLIRYAVIFYLSSIVRYHPATLDPNTQSAQSFLMDSVSNQVPMNLLAGMLDGITGRYSYFEPRGMRT